MAKLKATNEWQSTEALSSAELWQADAIVRLTSDTSVSLSETESGGISLIPPLVMRFESGAIVQFRSVEPNGCDIWREPVT